MDPGSSFEYKRLGVKVPEREEPFLSYPEDVGD